MQRIKLKNYAAGHKINNSETNKNECCYNVKSKNCNLIKILSILVIVSKLYATRIIFSFKSNED